eukprot:CAMPEP_0204896778 /NCGR_PEP_ID=MMETSP1397-20131031/361_1 /ASSEMBLY_ACC=CAM_ASM_000891 /TAXON_ID=49980 /ORGANISM="Climacostomum Climacostomum virens, Strain Stock W-24" /LENGTH=150 /DNA_ID=CAMNT_0052064441 /DNA_START=48 /DNA_END=502 /DNA_ORIENTATION=-
MKEYDCWTVGNPRGDKKLHDNGLKRALSAKRKIPSDEFRSPSDPEYTLFVGKLSPDTTDSDLIEFFSRYGRVMHAIVVKDLFGNESRGYGFVEFVQKQDAEEAFRRSRGKTLKGARVILIGREGAISQGGSLEGLVEDLEESVSQGKCGL